MSLTKDFEYEGTRYQIGKMRATEGSWCLSQVLTKLLPSAMEGAFARETGASLPAGRSGLSQAEFLNIQAIALTAVRRYESNGIPMPVFVAPDTFAVAELEYDLSAVMMLTVESLIFSLKPFFQAGGLGSLLNSLGLNQKA